MPTKKFKPRPRTKWVVIVAPKIYGPYNILKHAERDALAWNGTVAPLIAALAKGVLLEGNESDH